MDKYDPVKLVDNIHQLNINKDYNQALKLGLQLYNDWESASLLYEILYSYRMLNDKTNGAKYVDLLLLKHGQELSQVQLLQNTLAIIDLHVNKIKSIKITPLPGIKGLSKWRSMNSSFMPWLYDGIYSKQPAKDMYLFFRRMSNFDYDQAKYTVDKSLGYTKHYNRNFIELRDKNLKLIQQEEVVDDTPRVIDYYEHGIQDGRIFVFNDELYFSGTGIDTNSRKRPQICIVKVKPFNILPTWKDCHNIQKNWLYIKEDNQQMLFISDWFPFTIIWVDTITGYTKIKYQAYHQSLYDIRGSGAPIPFKDGYLCLVHQVYYGKLRNYYHRFVYLDNQYRPVSISSMFYLHHIGVQYASGLNWFDGKVGITYSIEDANTSLMLLDTQYIQSILKDL